MAARRLEFAYGYCESLTLADGRVVQLRLMRADDQTLLAQGLQRVSAQSRCRRFLTTSRSSAC